MSCPLVIFHKQCPDGVAAAWAAWKILGDLAEYRPASYGEEPPPVVSDEGEPRDVLIVDFSYPRDAMVRMHGEAKSLLVIDHHKTAREACEGLAFCTFDMERSGAGLAWDVLHKGAPRPWLIDYVEDRDLWRHRLADSKAINAWLHEQPRTVEGFDAASRASLDVVRKVGAEILAQQRAYIDDVKRRAALAMVGRFGPVPVVECGRHLASEIVGELSEGHAFAASWQVRDGVAHYELRSRGDGADVSEIARSFGGGGHRNAAGFSAPRPVHFNVNATLGASPC